ncbi:hypothetical protein [Streptomyces sp. NPDC059816]|uniref:hypothetical protein n=1 Tax=Streptomyces sp. NPDC059816 TaxID=3346960 RepID=UPI0036550888
MSPRSNSTAPETVLVHDGTTARFDGARLLIVRQRTTWTIPVRALRSTDLRSDGTVRVEISGPADAAEHGLDPVLELRGPNRRAAEAFFEQLRPAIARAATRSNGHALVDRYDASETRRELSPGVRRALRITGLLLLYYAVLVVTDWFVTRTLWLTMVLTFVSGTAGIGGGTALWRVGRRFRSLWLLRRRGITVVGTATGRVRIWSDGLHLWEFSLMDFTTVDGRRMKGVHSVVTVWCLSEAARGPVELTYDPEHPARASRRPTVGFVGRTLLLAVVGLVASGAFVLAHLVAFTV